MNAIIQATDEVLLRNLDTTHYLVGQPFHIHTSKTTNKPWACSSPYCEQIVGVDPPEAGGPAVIHKGREPWRGR